MKNTLKGSATYGYDSSARSAQEMREAKCVKREGFDKRELTLLSHSELGSESIPCCKLTVLAGKILKPSWIMRLCPKAWFWASYGFRFAHPTANPLQDDSYDNSHNEPLTLHSSPLTKSAFTMAEILLSLTIIGVVAAITLPSLTGNINERTWNTQRKALYARMSQAIALMPALNGYGSGSETTETFVTSGLSKVLKINNICGTNYQDCGIVASYTNMTGAKLAMPTTLYSLNGWFSLATYSEQSYSTPDANAAAFETQNGESIIAFYNRNCRAQYLDATVTSFYNTYGFPTATMCVNFIYDLNGKKGPNTVGKDIGVMTVFNATDSIVVAPLPSASKNAGNNTFMNWNLALQTCKAQDEDSRMPNIDELSAMMINKDILTLETNAYWSGSVVNEEQAWEANNIFGTRFKLLKDRERKVRCVRR